MSFRRLALFVVFFLLGACSLLLDTDELSSVPDAAGAEAGTVLADATVRADAPEAAAPADAGRDSGVPPTATVWAQNGHAYELVDEENISWKVAEARARLRGGHLVTLDSREENLFVWALVISAADGRDYTINGPYIGLAQAPDAGEPDGGWGWVTGEPFAFAAWNDGEPNDSEGDDTAIYFRGPKWADVPSNEARPSTGYVVEYEPR